MKSLTRQELDLLITIQKHLDSENTRPDLVAALLHTIERIMPEHDLQTRKRPAKEVIDLLLTIDDKLYDTHGAPHGNSGDPEKQKLSYNSYLTAALSAIKEADIHASDITGKVLAVLENENRHAMIDVCQIIKSRKTLEQIIAAS